MLRDAFAPADAPPRLADAVCIEPAAGGEHWLVSVDGVPVSRASSAVAATLRAMDGRTSLDELRRRFAPDQTREEFAALADRFRRAGLLQGSERRTAGRIVYRPPLTIQFATLRAPRLFDRLHWLVRPLLRGWARWPLAALIAGGLGALGLQAADAVAALTSPLPLLDVLVVALVLIAATFVHEGAHGVALTHGGGRPRRAGAMLLYLGPAFFVDVTDAWRLPSRASRVAVALAGPAVHVAIAAVAALGALFAPDPDVRRALLVVSCACLAVVALNLIPFVRFDGYIALMSALDEPNLRSRTMADAAASLRRLLFGGPPAPRALARWWSVPFGILSALVPTVLVVVAIERALHALSGTGAVGAFVVLALPAAVAVAVGVVVARWLAAGWTRGRGRARFVLVSTVVVAAVLGIAGAIPVDSTRTLGFTVADNRVELLAPVGATEPDVLSGGEAVDLTTSGILADLVVARGVARPTAQRASSAPLTAFSPVEVRGVEVPARVIGTVDVSAPGLPASGRAIVHLGPRSLLATVWSSHIVEPASVLFSPLVPPTSDTKESR
ncbi:MULTISPECIES: daptide biosynthesis intramembrane metalloprotease [Microbacterium]|uniref:daptide biosynthesis intramembrane metalloprotease n=1 Tax=Microbacterium TaxID=33882 RepID=UPI002789FE64|nr:MULTISPECIES: daptide biosynthesis intramembrane metalloprotease [Microbacterium]MDQ1074110.1 putative peptide zinc metalloprotease protein [Microbacterium sp. SORGH_AS_0969]MDQ1114336.1 putative peptide zinc metalloprotease protein [Microbacterium testaceum]